MITRKEFLEALETIRCYELQISRGAVDVTLSKESFISHFKMSSRAEWALTRLIDRDDSSNATDDKEKIPLSYFEGADVSGLIKYRSVGLKTIKEVKRVLTSAGINFI